MARRGFSHIVAVDGRPVDPDLGPNALLVGKADKPVELTLRRDGADREAVVVPLASDHATRYYDLVARQRTAVREASGGRLGYLHIPATNPAGWAELHRDLFTEVGRDGLIVDLRDAQGGNASHLVAEKLARRIIGWSVSRYEELLSYPVEAPRGPIGAITNEYASSGGDIVIQALKSYGIATVVGTRTWGGVISCYFNELVDGTLVTRRVIGANIGEFLCAHGRWMSTRFAAVVTVGRRARKPRNSNRYDGNVVILDGRNVGPATGWSARAPLTEHGQDRRVVPTGVGAHHPLSSVSEPAGDCFPPFFEARFYDSFRCAYSAAIPATPGPSGTAESRVAVGVAPEVTAAAAAVGVLAE